STAFAAWWQSILSEARGAPMTQREAAVAKLEAARHALQRAEQQTEADRAQRVTAVPKVRMYEAERRQVIDVIEAGASPDEGLRRVEAARLWGLRSAVERAREALRELDRKSPTGRPVIVEFRDCVLSSGKPARLFGHGRGV